jgi:hypothetical protein
MCIQYDQVSDTIKCRSDLYSKVFSSKKGKGHVYVKIRNGMYDLPQASRIGNDCLVKHLAADGYTQSKHPPGLFQHETRNISFALVVNDFGWKHVGQGNAQHLIDILIKVYKITTYWKGDDFLELTIQLDYKAWTCNISMPGYIKWPCEALPY